MRTWAIAVGAAVVLAAPLRAAELVPGEPPLTSEMVLRYEEFFEWVFQTQLTESQQHELEGLLTDIWKAKNEKEIRVALDNLRNRDDVAKMAGDEREMIRSQVQPQMLKELAKDKTLLSAWALAVSANVHKAMMPGKPPLTRQMTDAYAELTAFAAHQGPGTVVAVDAPYRDAAAKALLGAWKKLPAAQKEALAKAPLTWAALRQQWPKLSASDKAKLKAAWSKAHSPEPAISGYDAQVLQPVAELGLKYEATSW